VARVLDLTPVCTYSEETKHASYNEKTFVVESFVVTSLNSQRLSAGEVSGLRRCRPHVAAVASEWGRPIY
jgi:hypothetical protein